MIITERGKTIRPGKVYLSNYKNKQKKVKVAHLRTAMEDNGSIRKNHLAVAWTTDLEKYLNILGRLTD
ncbi:hypothetical protein [Maridesulfovibrio sp.]|uniref:hypothetical protein n=1 Tax=Maridesulfovibrio sp. TaxID=2795000 RepID=UPI0029CA3E71|nr:hypothetical protein [Maridesulfovibrio sp.]